MASLTRRNFVKGAGAAAAAAVGAALGCSSGMALEPTSATEANVEIRPGVCQQCIYLTCAFNAKVQDGVLLELEGNKKRRQNLGTLCPRANVYPMYQYNPYRIKAPMKRTNPEKGVNIDPGWVEITWDEALDLAASKLKEVRDRNPLELVYQWNFAENAATQSGIAGETGFYKALGTRTIDSSKGQQCALHYCGTNTMGSFSALKPDYYYSNYIIFLGRGPGMSGSFADGTARGCAHFIKKGGRLIVVEPQCSIEASLGEWQPIKPSTDLSFVYGILHTMLYEHDDWDKESVKQRTDACFLIGPDGEYIRGESGKIQVFDEKSGAVVDYNAEGIDPAIFGTYDVNGVQANTVLTLFKDAMRDFTPEWAEPICTVSAADIRRYAKELIDNAQIGSTITIDGQELPYRPAAIIACRGITNHEDGTFTDFGCRFINFLLGNQFVPGGINVNFGGALGLDDDEIIKPISEGSPANLDKMHWPPDSFDLWDVFPHKHSTDSLMWQVIAEGPEKYGFEIKPRVLFTTAGNSVTCTCSPETVMAALPKFEYIIYAFAYHIDETAMYADLLLPSHSRIEGFTVTKNVSGNTFSSAEPDYSANTDEIMVRNTVDPLYDTMRPNDIILEIADRMGINAEMNAEINKISGMFGKALENTPYALTGDTKYTMEEIWDRMIKNRLDDDTKGLDYVIEQGLVPLPKKDVASCYRYLATPNARYTFYLMYQKHSGEFITNRLKENGVDENYLNYSWEGLVNAYSPLPYYPTTERKLHNAPSEYDLYTFTYRMPMYLYRFGGQDQNAWNREWSKANDPEFGTIMMNSATAKARGLKSGDRVILEGYNGGKTSGVLFVTDRVHPEALGIGGALGRCAKVMGDELLDVPNYAALINGNMGYLNIIHGGTENTTAVKVIKA